MTLSGAHAVPWHAVAQFHREVMRRAGEAFFALPITASATERWSSLTGFEPEQLAGPWQVDFDALASPHLQRDIRTGIDEAFIGGPCWFRWASEGEQQRHPEWIPLIYREVRIQDRDGHLSIVPAQAGWHVCPLVTQFLEQHNIRTAAPLDEILPDLLPVAESKAAEDGHGLSRALVDAFRLVVPEIGELLDQSRDDFPVDRVEFVPSPWVLFTPSPGDSAITPHIVRDYAQLEHHLTAAPQDIGGLRALEDTPGAAVQTVPEVVQIVPLNNSQGFAVEAALTGRPITVISGPPGCGKSQVVLSILLNAWASSTSVLLASDNNQTVDAVRQRLKPFESDFELAVGAGAQQFNNVDEALGRINELVTAKQGESHYGGSPSARKRSQLIKKKQQLRGMLGSQVPQRVSQAIESALKSHGAQRRALAELKSRREELVATLRHLGIEDEPDCFGERVVNPLREWRNGIAATHRLIKADTQRDATLRRELSAARAERDSVLAGYRIETRPDQALPWLLAEPGFASFERALVALFNKLQQPIENPLDDGAWDEAYDAWSSSDAAAEWERKAREMAALIRPAGITLKEKADEVRAARETLDSAQRSVQEATQTSSLDVRRGDLDEWAACYSELCALPHSTLAFRPWSRSAELVGQLERIEGRLRLSFPVHLWANIGALNESGRARLSAVIERAREWTGARQDWEDLGTLRDEIEAETEALRRRLVALGTSDLSTEVTPAACAAIASKLNAKAAVAASAAAAWSKREARERLPGELVELATQIHAAGSGVPIKERWVNGAGAPLIAALGSLTKDPGVETIAAVQHEVLGSAAADPVVQNWRQAYEAEIEAVAAAEQLERIPPREVRLSHWKSRRPASLPAALEVAGAIDGDDSHPVWAYLQACKKWSQEWATYRDEDAPALEHTAQAEGAWASQRIGKAAEALPEGKDKTWLASFASGSTVSEPWPVDDIAEKAARWRPEPLQAELEAIDAQLEGITFETAREQWLERIARDREVLRSLDALRDHYKRNHQHIADDGYAHFEQALKAQPVWITTGMSTQSIPMQPGLFDLLVIDDATQCTLTNMLPLIFRAKRLVIIGDPEQLPSMENLGTETERTLVARFGIEEWAGFLGHAGNDVFKTAVGALPRRQADVISLVEDK